MQLADLGHAKYSAPKGGGSPSGGVGENPAEFPANVAGQFGAQRPHDIANLRLLRWFRVSSYSCRRVARNLLRKHQVGPKLRHFVPSMELGATKPIYVKGGLLDKKMRTYARQDGEFEQHGQHQSMIGVLLKSLSPGFAISFIGLLVNPELFAQNIPIIVIGCLGSGLVISVIISNHQN